LIIGGSRGLGEVAAKLLCAGGAKVKLTYYQGKEDAWRVVDEISSTGGIADFSHFDVLNPRGDLLETSLNGWCPTHLYYFATPFIAPGMEGGFSPNLFERFCDYYVTGFINTVNQLRSLGLKHVFYPSTVFIDELPINMSEYVAAKAAGEMVCNFLEKNHREMVVYRLRFPRMATDQTVSLVRVNKLDLVPIMIKALRCFRDSTTS
jgi:NAD(P)-dependent dehydrogenase (short-subunit alcohol dehydrogenase family)